MIKDRLVKCPLGKSPNCTLHFKKETYSVGYFYKQRNVISQHIKEKIQYIRSGNYGMILYILG